MLNKGVERSGIRSALFLILEARHSVFLPLCMILAVVFLVDVLYQAEAVPLYSSFRTVFILHEC